MKKHSQVSGWCARAFSLVEVTLALGVIGAAFIPLIGLLSVGLSALRESQVDVKTALIAQRLLAEAQLVPFDQLGGVTEYLDIEGNKVAQGNSVFTAVLTVQNAAGALGSTNLKQITITLNGTAVGERPRVFASTAANLGD